MSTPHGKATKGEDMNVAPSASEETRTLQQPQMRGHPLPGQGDACGAQHALGGRHGEAAACDLPNGVPALSLQGFHSARAHGASKAHMATLPSAFPSQRINRRAGDRESAT